MGAGKSKKKVNVDSASSYNNNNDVDDSNNGTNENSYLDDDDFGDAPEFLVCPITQEVMDDPVITSDGHTFERSAIEAWLSNNNTNPMTGSEIKSKALTPNFALRDACAAYKAAAAIPPEQQLGTFCDIQNAKRHVRPRMQTEFNA